MIEIWQPRYKDSTALVATYKVQPGRNLIKFTKAKHLEGLVFEIDASELHKCPVESNGRIDCYAVPMSKLRQVD